MHFTSLSPDGQPISLAIVTDDSTSFYAEFSDFDINRCDDWVKENVIRKLTIKDFISANEMVLNKEIGNVRYSADIDVIKYYLREWLIQFSDYQLNFIVDCGWFTWYKFVELMGEWEECNVKHFYSYIGAYKQKLQHIDIPCRIGLPKLPPNFPPVPQDLNELIAFTKNISISEAFNLDREELIEPFGLPKEIDGNSIYSIPCKAFGETRKNNKYNALFDAKVTKEVYNKLFMHR